MNSETERYLKAIRTRKNWISFNTNSSSAYLHWGSGVWVFMKKEDFYYMIENNLIYCASDFKDSEYIYFPTAKGLNYHLISMT